MLNKGDFLYFLIELDRRLSNENIRGDIVLFGGCVISIAFKKRYGIGCPYSFRTKNDNKRYCYKYKKRLYFTTKLA